MSLQRPNARLKRFTPLQDLCPHCRFNAIRRLSDNVRSLQGSAFSRLSAVDRSSRQALRARRFSTAVSLTFRETVQASPPDPNISDIPLPLRNHGSSGGKLIRNQLREWNIKHEQEKLAQRPEQLPLHGRITELPHAFFLPEPESPKDAFDEDMANAEALDDDDARRYDLEPGDMTLVFPKALSRNQFAVYLGALGFQELFLLQNGRWLVFEDERLPRIIIRGFASQQELLDENITKHLPKRPVEREVMPGHFSDVHFVGDVVASASNPMVQRMASLAEEVVVFQRNNVPLLDSIYGSYSKETDFVSVKFARLLKGLVGPAPSHAAQFAILSLLQRDPTNIIMFQPNGEPNSLSVAFVPKELKKTCAIVVEWARHYQEAAAQASMGNDVSKMLRDNPVTAFIEKSRRIILSSRKIRSPTTSAVIGPSKYQLRLADGSIEAKPSGETWSHTDRMILDFVYDTYCRRPVAPSITRHSATASLILRAVGAYPKMDLGRAVGALFLQELGAMSPWASNIPRYVSAPVPGTMGSEELTRLVAASRELAQSLGFQHDSRQNSFKDTFQGLRKDLGDLEVFCIDSANAGVIDDGISVEPCIERPGCYWIHAHIAHPTAFFERDHLFARASRLQMQTLYAPHNYHSLLPNTVAQAMSLSNGAKALTVSTLLAENGTVLDIKVYPTKVNNVIRLDTDAVEQLMDPEDTEYATLIVGSDPNMTPEKDNGRTTEPTTEDLEKVRKNLPQLSKLDALLATRALARERESQVLLQRWKSNAQQSVVTTKIEQFEALRHHRSLHYFGDPTIKITATRFPSKVRGPKAKAVPGPSVLSGSMILTGESFGKWCRDRNVPVIYEGVHYHPSYPISRLNQLEKYERYRRPSLMPSVHPTYFASANLQQYIKVTSPLRRFQDMICQWNINAYLQAEAQGKLSGGEAIDEAFRMPWPVDDIQDILEYEVDDIIFLAEIFKASDKNLVINALFRAHHFQEAKLPEVWDVQIIDKVPQDSRSSAKHYPGVPEGRIQTGVLGTLLPFKIRAAMMQSEERWEDAARLYQYLPCRIDSVVPTTANVYMTAVGPPSDDFTQKGPIHIWSLEGKEDRELEAGAGTATTSTCSDKARTQSAR